MWGPYWENISPKRLRDHDVAQYIPEQVWLMRKWIKPWEEKGIHVSWDFLSTQILTKTCLKKLNVKRFPVWPSCSANNFYQHSDCFVSGGYEVSSSVPNFDFHINVCRGITPEKTGHTQGCAANSSMCRIDKNHQIHVSEDVGNINYASKLHFSLQNDIILVYNTTKKVSGCLLLNPVTTITFKCPNGMVSEQIW